MVPFVTFVWRSIFSAFGIASVVLLAATWLLAVRGTGELPAWAAKWIELWVPSRFLLRDLFWIPAGFFFLGAARAWAELWRDYLAVTTQKLLGDARPEEVSTYLLRDTAWGFDRVFSLDRLEDFEATVHDATANGVIGLWGRSKPLPLRSAPLVKIPPDEIARHELSLMGEFGGPNRLVDNMVPDTTHQDDLHLNWREVKRWHRPLPFPLRAFRRLQWSLFHINMTSRKSLQAVRRVAVLVRFIPRDLDAWKKKQPDQEDEEAE